MCMSMSGSFDRSSTMTQATMSTAARAIRPRTRGDPHPHTGASLTPRRRATSQADRRTAASQLIRPGVRTGDSGTNSQAARVATAASIIGIQNSQWKLRWLTIGPASTMPAPPPTAAMAAMIPTAPATLIVGNSSRTMPNESGRTAPPMPWMARAMIRTVIEWARPATTEPAASAPRVTTSILSLPTMSPTRPRMGVKIDADNKNAVRTQVTVF